MNPELQKAVAELRRLGATPEEIQAYIAEHGGGGMDELLREQGLMGVPRESLKLDVRQPTESTGALPFDKSRPGDLEALKGAPSGLAKVAPEAARGAAALTLSAAQGLPGMELYQSAAGALGSRFTDNPMSVRESRDALRGETSKIPAEVRLAAQLPVAMASGGVMSKAPGAVGRFMRSPARAGTAFGAADQGLSANDMSLEQRIMRTAIAGGAGTVAGFLADAGTTGARALATQSPGTNVASRKAAMKAADVQNYGAAAREGAANTSPYNVVGPVTKEQQAIRDVLNHPDIKPFADMVRGKPAGHMSPAIVNRKFPDADEATVLRETFRLMSKQQTGLARQLREQGFDAAKQLQHDNIAAAKDEILKVADPVMPSLRPAVREHARRASEIEAVGVGADAARRIVGAPPSGRRLGTQSAEAYLETLRRMTPEQRRAMIEGILGGTKERIGLTGNLPSVFGAATSMVRPWKVAGFLREAGDPRQRILDDLIRKSAIGATTFEELLRSR